MHPSARRPFFFKARIHTPVFATHNLYRILNIFIGSGFERGFLNGLLVRIQVFIRVVRTDRLERRAISFACFLDPFASGLPASRPKGRFLPCPLADPLDCPVLYFLGKGVSIYARSVKPLCLGGLLEGHGVIPSGGGGSTAIGWPFEKMPRVFAWQAKVETIREETAASRSSDHQYVLRPFAMLMAFDVVDLLFNVRFAAGRVGGNADESSDFWTNNHRLRNFLEWIYSQVPSRFYRLGSYLIELLRKIPDINSQRAGRFKTNAIRVFALR